VNRFSLSDGAAFVTGAGSGIGQAIAIGLAEAGAHVALFDLPGSKGLDDTVKAIAGKGRRAIKTTGDVADAGAMEAAVGSRERHPLELAHRPHRVEMAEQQNLRRAAAEFREQMIAAIGARQSRNTAADRLEPRGELGAASIDRGLVGRRRFDPHERFGRLENPIAVGAAKVVEVYNRGHGSDRARDTKGREDTEEE